eukprot:CAMPEP_0185595168 /NCGR_PEP_ID=MMETSP0434-20130131/77441_1 /TAXON_ID=626734 ORGANISM="Favella taraikaensis, Strain Fe Narragansett Bay" /NCGR_SAMPLE_ID=MMETSP0434 /ASSEMBLY_ACC=CAM_ASM_000379 /LENGTH=133 /DNA_ID=CAMNT_0028222987 /DNA_START=9 /DNA_END=406 /DNA_ORIENTATION=+
MSAAEWNPLASILSSVNNIRSRARVAKRMLRPAVGGFPSALAPLGNRPRPPPMPSTPPSSQRLQVTASAAEHPITKLQEAAREDHENLFGPVDASQHHPRAPPDPSDFSPVAMADGSGSAAELLKSVPKPLAP